MIQLASSSAFDEALARPFLNEPVKKRWSWATESTVDTSSSDDLSVKYREYEAPAVEVGNITFSSINEKLNEEEEQEALLVLAKLEEGRAFELAILQERHQDISIINKEIKIINDIQKDLAQTVEAQEEEIQQVAEMTLESLNHATAGLSYFLMIEREQARENCRRRHAAVASMATLLMVIALHWAWNWSDESVNGGSPRLH